MTKSKVGVAPINLFKRLQHFCDKHYEEQQNKQDNLPFCMVSINSIREDHEAILAQTHKVLSKYENGDNGVCQRSCRLDHSFMQLPSASPQAFQG